jgi:hypothetical protein
MARLEADYAVAFWGKKVHPRDLPDDPACRMTHDPGLCPACPAPLVRQTDRRNTCPEHDQGGPPLEAHHHQRRGGCDADGEG